MGAAMDGAATAAKGGFVRDALVGSYPRMAALLEEALLKLQRDTNVSTCAVHHLLLLGSLVVRWGVTAPHCGQPTDIEMMVCVS